MGVPSVQSFATLARLFRLRLTMQKNRNSKLLAIIQKRE
ncbi:hypothetical protein SIAM614_26538 [Stappia aggregata IAM 12614]|uniref:Uncharacterized protein n=1 Tax=Roseibium aggregatum (strain ATCC 25650 / DSM 13394 / JCM 20685 / NBRC 16684 / NCIMB 2208 / IAM 12614 / B1) TaxID=384765 RepID=A0NWW1_ROSAI|nr:hypothetical protein SIAM614_26538 [Stappia aggregata IAM 12614] [Roseibium aggregatum IAM 12614]